MKHYFVSISLIGAFSASASTSDKSVDPIDDLEEASGFHPTQPGLTDAQENHSVWFLPQFLKSIQTRGSVFIQSGFTNKSASAPTAGFRRIPDSGEISLNVKSPHEARVTCLADVQANIIRDPSGVMSRNPRVNQGFLQIRLMEDISLSAGKERLRRAPGMFFAPSDVLNNFQSVPGASEDRSGTWGSRLSKQTLDYSLDLIALPFDSIDTKGLPKSDSTYQGTLVRYFRRTGRSLDLAIEAIQLERDSHQPPSNATRTKKLGGFAQYMLPQSLKIYGEGQLSQRTIKPQSQSSNQSQSHLLGFSYEGIADMLLRAEWYASSKSHETPRYDFPDHSYVLVNGSIIDLYQRWNLNLTLIKSMETNQALNFAKAEYLIDSQQAVSATLVTAVRRASRKHQAMLEFKYSF